LLNPIVDSLEYIYVQVRIIAQKKTEPSQLIPRKLTENLELLIVDAKSLI